MEFKHWHQEAQTQQHIFRTTDVQLSSLVNNRARDVVHILRLRGRGTMESKHAIQKSHGELQIWAFECVTVAAC
eukprot:1048973-Lingulodinium_polyedra.AAC.1